MKTRLYVIAGALLALSLAPAHASSLMMCSPAQTSGAQARAVTNPVTGTSYSLNSRGCASMVAADATYFATQGFTIDAPTRSIVVTGITAATSPFATVPASAYIRDIVVQETAGHTVTGGLKFGTTAGGTDVVAVLLLSGGAYNVATDVSLAKRVFGSSTAQPLYIDAVSAWNGATVNVTVVYSFF